MKESIFSKMKKIKKEQWVVCGLTGLLLLIMSVPVKKEEKKQEPEKEEIIETPLDIRQEYEQQLTQALTQVQGVGKVVVSITMESTERKIVEKDIPANMDQTSEKDGKGQEQIRQSQSTTETTVYEETEKGEHLPYISSSIYPEIRGVLVIAQGGDRPELVCQIQEAVMALFHVEAHKIKVLKMK